MALDDHEKNVERSDDNRASAPEEALQEANSGKQELVDEQRAHSEYLRAGGRSGITGEFGKVILTGLDDLRDTIAQTAGTPGDAAARGEGGEPQSQDRAGEGPGAGRTLQDFPSESGGASRTIQELPGDTQPGGGGLGRLVMDGLQAISKGFRRQGRSASAELGEQAATEAKTAGQTIQEPPSDSRPGSASGGLGRVLMDGIQSISQAFRRRPSEAAGPSDVPQSSAPERTPGFVPDHLARETGSGAGRIVDTSARTSEAESPAPDRRGDAASVVTPRAFVGERIERDVEPATHAVQRGETLERIASDHLGQRASQEDIRSHVREIESLNHLRHGERLADGRELRLPGHTDSGGTVTLDADGTRHTAWQDGVERVEHSDQTGYVRRPAEGGGFSEHHWGPRQGDNYDFRVGGDGDYRVDSFDQHLGSMEQRLRGESGDHSAEQQRIQHIRENMQEFEQRAGRDGLPPEEVARTYRELEGMLRSDATTPTTPEDRLRLAEQISRQAAHPDEVNQGQYGTCQVAATEARTYMRSPSDAAHMIREVSTTGHFTEADGTVVNVLPDGQRSLTSDGDPQRSYASQIFQVTAVNTYWAHHDLTDRDGNVIARAGQIRYEQHPSGTREDGSPDFGERLMDYSRRPPQEIPEPGSDPPTPIDQPFITAGTATEISNRITGESERDVVLSNSRSRLDGTVQFHDQAELESTLTRMRAEGRLPAVMEVNAANDPFWSDSGGGAAGGSGSWHVVTIRDYDPATGRVSIDNQWGQQSDHSVSARELYLSTLPTGSDEIVQDLETRVTATPDTLPEFGTQMDLFRQQRASDDIATEQFDTRLADALNRSYGESLFSEGADAEAQHRANEIRFGRIFAGLPEEEQRAIRNRLDPQARSHLAATIEQLQREGASGPGSPARPEVASAGHEARFAPDSEHDWASVMGILQPHEGPGGDFRPITSRDADPVARQWQGAPIELPAEGAERPQPGAVPAEVAAHEAVHQAESPRPAGAEAPERPAEAPARAEEGERSAEGRRERAEHGPERHREATDRLAAHPNFRGEVIGLDVEPARHEYRRGERLSDIAREHLGSGASDEDVQRHVREIERASSIRPGHMPRDGQRLVLPGHTADGGYVRTGEDPQGRPITRTTWADGVERVVRELPAEPAASAGDAAHEPRTAGFVRRPAEGGGYTEHRWGPRPEDNVDLARTADGRYQIDGRDAEPGDSRIGRARWDNPDESAEANQAGADLHARTESMRLRMIREHGEESPEVQRLDHMQAQMAEFEQRARRDGVPPHEVAETYHEVQRLLESRATTPTDAGLRLALADQVLEHAAHPELIDQGQHNTCNVTSVEARTYARSPSAAAHLVTEVATSGHFTERGEGGRRIDLDPASIRPDSESEADRSGPPTYSAADDDRDYASQLFQVTAVNIHYAHHDLGWDRPGGGREVVARAGELVYTQRTSESPHDTGERLIRRTAGQPITEPVQPIMEPGTDPARPISEPVLRSSDYAEISERITGSAEHDVVLTNERDAMANTTHFDSPQALESEVARLQAEGRLPAVVRVHTGEEPFLSDSSGGAAGGSGGWHVVNITGYDPTTHRISIDNQWGSDLDRGGERALSPHDLYMATLRPGSPEILSELRAREGRTHSFDDRMELLRHERQAEPPVPAAELNRRMAEALADSFREHPSRHAMGQTADGMLIPANFVDPVQDAREVRFVQSLYNLDQAGRRDVLAHLPAGELRDRVEDRLSRYTRAMEDAPRRSGERDGAAVHETEESAVNAPAEQAQSTVDRLRAVSEAASAPGERSQADILERQTSYVAERGGGGTGRGAADRADVPAGGGEGGADRAGDRTAEPGERESSEQTPDHPSEGPGQSSDTTFATHPNFRGEIIRRDVEPDRHTYRRGESLQEIAEDHLGEGASRQEIRRHVLEIERLNHISDPRSIEAGTVLILPGHDTNGACIVRDADGNVHTSWGTGTQRHVSPDGTPGRVFRPGADGSYTDHHWGPPESGENYDIARTADGQYLINGTDRLEALEQQLRENPEENREELERLEHIQQSLREFDARAQREGLSPDEVGRTHFEVVRLLETESEGRGPDRAERFRLADQIMTHAAHPTDINQGEHNSCGVAATEVMMYSRHPAEAARMVTDIALTNEYETTSGGTDVRIDNRLRRPEPLPEDRPETPLDRDYASQIFQLTAVNVHYARHGLHTPEADYPPAEVLYTHAAGRHSGLAGDTGERIIVNGQAVVDERGLPIDSPALGDDDVSEVMNSISGSDPPETILASAERGLNAQGRPDAGRGDNQTFESERELQQQLARMADEGRLPAPIVVHSQHQPLFDDSGAGLAGGSGSWHMVNVTAYHPAEAGPPPRPARVELDNQWGPYADHTGERAIPLHDLYLATQPVGDREVISDLERRERRETDPEAELQASLDRLRQQRLTGAVSQEDYNRQLAEVINEYPRDALERHPELSSPEEQNLALNRMAVALADLEPADRQEVYDQLQEQQVEDMLTPRVEMITAVRSRDIEQVQALQREHGAPAAETAHYAPEARETEPAGRRAASSRGGDTGSGVDSDATADTPEAPSTVHDGPAPRSEGQTGSTGLGAYTGEDIRREVAPATHTVRPNETPEDIARTHLGAGASEADIAAHAREINEVNGGFLMEGQEIMLPGHTESGGFVTMGEGGHRQTVWRNGTVRVDNEDGTGWVRRPTEGGGVSEHHWGRAPADNYDLERTGDGRYRIADAGHEMRDVTDPGADVRVQRSRLEGLLESREGGADARTARIGDDMREFEQRAREADPPLSDAEVARTYAEVSRLLEHEGEEPLSAPERMRVAEQVIHQSAYPETINQGDHETCGAAASEVRMYTRSPSDAARVVTDVATTGHYQTRPAPGRTIEVDPRNLDPGPEERGESQRDDARTQASQIFETAFISTIMDERSRTSDPPATYRYEQHPAGTQNLTEGIPPPSGDSGERVIEEGPNGRHVTRFDGLDASELQGAEQSITGRTGAPVLINGTQGEVDHATQFSTEQDLRSRLEHAREHDEMPIVMWVDSGNQPFRADSRGGSAGGAGAGHFVTITDYDRETGMVTLDNQWGADADHNVSGDPPVDRRVSVHDLYRSSMDHHDQLQRDVAWDREHGTVDGTKELDLLLADRMEHDITAQEFDDGLVRTMRESHQRWATSGETYPGERARTEALYSRLVAAVRRDDAARAGRIEQRVDAEA